MPAELQGLSAESSQYPNRSPEFLSMLPLPKPRVMVNSPPLRCGGEDSIYSLASALGKEGAKITFNSYDTTRRPEWMGAPLNGFRQRD